MLQITIYTGREYIEYIGYIYVCIYVYMVYIYIYIYICMLYIYSGISIRRTHHKAHISIRRTVNLGMERFPSQTLIRKSL